MGSLVFDLSIKEKDKLNNNYLYKDLKLDSEITENKRDVKVSLDYQAINNGIFNMFLFNQGERILLPEFGNSLYRYLYEPINEHTARKITNEIELMFQRWEPRVEIDRIDIEPRPDENTYIVSIHYSVPSLNSQKILNFNVAINARRE